MKQYYWCRILLDNDNYYYIYVVKEAAIEIYKKTGFEINIDPSEVPTEIREKEENKHD
tara:strand:+ start:314 stop:487 length:174 start_codon:yes stop_codon:yes gene_type:complete